MLKHIIYLIILSLAVSACTPQHVQARFYLVKADDAYTKAYNLRVRKDVTSEERNKYYVIAREYFLKAYRKDPSVFTLGQIDKAVDACLRLEDQENVKLFEDFAQQYAKKHPTEAEYGDATLLLGGLE